MLHWLLQADTWLFFIINKTLANPVFDLLMPIITNDKIFRLPILLIWIVLIIFGGKRGRIVAFLILLTILLSDQLSSFVVKPLFARIRPCNVLSGVRLLVPCSGSYSFTSSHATNLFAAAGLFANFYRKGKWYFFGYAALVAYSRPYVGVHYPLDVIGGALLGLISAQVILILYKKVLTSALPGWFQLERPAVKIEESVPVTNRSSSDANEKI